MIPAERSQFLRGLSEFYCDEFGRLNLAVSRVDPVELEKIPTARAVAETLLSRYDLGQKKVNVVVRPEMWAAGCVQPLDEQYRIGIRPEYLKPPRIRNAVICHEVAHVLLMIHGLQDAYNPELFAKGYEKGEEDRTEVAACVLGFGDVLLAAAAPIAVLEKRIFSLSYWRWLLSREVSLVPQPQYIGYLSVEDLAAIRAMLHELRYGSEAGVAD